VIIGRPTKDVDVDHAASAILGYTMLNDFSARDIQRGEMNVSTGPYKGKDFAWGLGPWIVTPDEFGDPSTLQMAVRVDGEVWATSTPGPMHWSFPEVISYTSQDELLNVGDVLGSGTVNSGCGFEIDRWIKPGATVELEADRIGVLSHHIAHPEGEPIRWRRAG
jgi:2-keto-4-pentenoate hydratase/2-oxohepta-3-ene-1,7-dioic acid hydratase in catechol pathway